MDKAEEEFNEKIKEERASLNRLGTNLTYNEYSQIIYNVRKAKTNRNIILQCDKTMLEKYDILEGNEGTTKLITPAKESSKILFYIHDDELYKILLKAHLELNHGNCDQMIMHLNQTYKNITYKDISIFLTVCKDCKTKHFEAKKYFHFNSECQIEIMSYEANPSNDYKFILIYQELYTKFVILKPLKSNLPSVVADNIINIFGTLGPPLFLKSNLVDIFLEDVIAFLKLSWPGLELQLRNTVNTEDLISLEIDAMIKNWLRTSKKIKWDEGLRFVQLKRNATVHPVLKKTPYEALFKHPVKLLSVKKDMKEETTSEMKIEFKKEHLDETDPLDFGKNEMEEDPLEIIEMDPLEIKEEDGLIETDLLEIGKTEPQSD